jgi:biotin carboxyl carrier protein
VTRTVTLRNGPHVHAVTVADEGIVRVDEGDAIQATADGNGVVRIGVAPVVNAWVAADGDARWVFVNGEAYRFEVEARARIGRGRAHHGSLSAPMPATVLRVHVKKGDVVKRGDVLLLLEAMKMELPVRANSDGVIADVRCREGELVQPGESLIEIDEPEA